MATLSIKISSGNLETYEALLLQLADAKDVVPVDQVELTFGDVTQVFPTAFALMAAYVGRTRDPTKRPLVLRRFGANPQSAKLERVMDAIGFLPAIAGKPAEPKEKGGIVPLTPIEPDTSPENIAARVIDTVTLTAQPTRDAKEIIYVVVSELVENVLLHGSPDRPAYLCAQLSAQKKKLELCVVDTGDGIQKSFQDGKDPDILKRLKNNESALGIALEAGRSSKGSDQSGFGLFIAREVAALTKGMFRVTSGSETIIQSKDGEKYRNHMPWAGTVVNLLLNVDRVGSIAEVYRELPRTRGKNERFLTK